MRARAFAYAALLWLLHAPAGADEPAARFEKANAAYASEDFDSAVEGYETLIREGHGSGAVFFNLGNAWLKQDKPARALAAYIEAQRRLPRDPDVRANLDLVRGHLGQPPPDAGWRDWLALRHRFTARELSAAFLALWFGAFFLAILYGWTRRRYARVVSSALMVFSLGLLPALAFVAQDEARALGVVIGKSAVRYAPAESGEARFNLEPGSVVRIGEQVYPWIQVFAAPGAGWMEQASVYRPAAPPGTGSQQRPESGLRPGMIR